ncbi:MAG: hypothetical protein LBB48_06445 [Treponema sp.]|nr:hypothetical protein [Treponema sp.]
MKKKLFLVGMAACALAFGFSAIGCVTIGGENMGTFSAISVPAKDFTSLGLVFTENVIENNRGEIFTYNALLKEAHALGADGIVNVTIDVKREGKKFMGLYLSPKETWYASATAIKYTEGTLKDVTTNNTESTTVTKEGIVMSNGGIGGGSSGSSSSPTSSEKKWYNPFTWFKK